MHVMEKMSLCSHWIAIEENEIRKYNCKKDNICTLIPCDYNTYLYDIEDLLCVENIETNKESMKSWIESDIKDSFEDIQVSTLTGDNINERNYVSFTARRVVIIEMKESEEQRLEREERERQTKIENQQIYEKYVIGNMKKLEEWSGCKYESILYDSDNDGIENKTFKIKVLGHEHLYFIVIDSKNNVFGHYHDSLIDK